MVDYPHSEEEMREQANEIRRSIGDTEIPAPSSNYSSDTRWMNYMFIGCTTFITIIGCLMLNKSCNSEIEENSRNYQTPQTQQQSGRDYQTPIPQTQQPINQKELEDLLRDTYEKK